MGRGDGQDRAAGAQSLFYGRRGAPPQTLAKAVSRRPAGMIVPLATGELKPLMKPGDIVHLDYSAQDERTDPYARDLSDRFLTQLGRGGFFFRCLVDQTEKGLVLRPQALVGDWGSVDQQIIDGIYREDLEELPLAEIDEAVLYESPRFPRWRATNPQLRRPQRPPEGVEVDERVLSPRRVLAGPTPDRYRRKLDQTAGGLIASARRASFRVLMKIGDPEDEQTQS